MLHRRAGGFTLIELMIALAILAILLTIAVPSFRDAVLNARMTAQANDLMADLNLARSEAVKRNLNVYLCTSSNGTSCTNSAWRLGWMVYVDVDQDGVWDAAEVPLKSRPAFDTGNNLVVTGDSGGGGGARQIPYHASGVSTIGAGEVVFTMCDARNETAVGAQLAERRGRRVTINPTGRPLAERYTCNDSST